MALIYKPASNLGLDSRYSLHNLHRQVPRDKLSDMCARSYEHMANGYVKSFGLSSMELRRARPMKWWS